MPSTQSYRTGLCKSITSSLTLKSDIRRVGLDFRRVPGTDIVLEPKAALLSPTGEDCASILMLALPIPHR